MEEDDDLTAGEQMAFCEAHHLSLRLADTGVTGEEIGQGFLTAALNQLRKSIGPKQTAMILYEAADDYAVRRE